jgi:hypothetical protein
MQGRPLRGLLWLYRPTQTRRKDWQLWWYGLRAIPLPTIAMVIRLLQANCRKSPDCLTTLLTKAGGRTDVILVQELWVDKRNPFGVWRTTQDPNYWFLYDSAIRDPRKPPRALIAIPKNLPLKWRKEHWDRDIVAIWIGEGADEILLINIYNPTQIETDQDPSEAARRWN